tara:strand:- start:1558 stop:1773 length:216 start_codon:yes stop_codon:yes gene_type:complete
MNIGDRIVERYEGRTATASHGIVEIVHVIKSINKIDQTCECELLEDNTYLTLRPGRIETIGFNYVLKYLSL